MNDERSVLMPTGLEEALEHLLLGTATEADRSAVRSALLTGVLVTGERAVAIGGNASDFIISTGDGNTILSIKGADATAIQELLKFTAPTRLHELPPPPRDFTGRADELAELTAKLEQGGITISGLHGLGGIGKTALALKLADQLKTRYPDAQFYLDLKGASHEPLSVSEALAHVIRAYHPTSKLPDSEAELCGLYQSVLQDQRALFLMDNAASAEQVEPLIPPTGCVLIVTSRQHFTMSGLFAKNLDALPTADSRDLLLAIAPRIGDLADEIAGLCGNLPLALRLAGSAVAKFVNLTPADYARRLQDGQRRLELIEASINLSYELLSEDLQKWWRLLAVFPDTFEEIAAGAIWNFEVDKTQDTLGELIAASMVEWNESTRRYRLHDLVRLFADSRLADEERQKGKRRHATTYQSVLAAALHVYLKGGDSVRRALILFDQEWKNVEAGHAWAAEQVDSDDQAAELCIAYSDASVYLLGLRKHPRERISWYETTVIAARRLKRRRDEGHALGNLGVAYFSLKESSRAIELFEQRLDIAREIGDRRGEGKALGNLANAYLSLGDAKQAIDFYEQALPIVRGIEDRRAEGEALGNLGNAYWTLGETSRAIGFHEQNVAIAREIGDRRGEGTAMGNLGNDYAVLGEIERAIEFYERQLLIVREIGDRRSEGDALWNMSQALYEHGERMRAIASAEAALAIYEQTEDPTASVVCERLSVWRA